MGKYKDFLVFLLSIVVVIVTGYFIGLILWPKINLPFSNPYNAVGKLTIAKQNPMTNSVRWGVFVILPSVLFFILSLNSKFKNTLIRIFAKNSGHNDNYANNTNKNDLASDALNRKITIIVICLFSIIPLLIFFQKDFTYKYFDTFHEGVEMTPAYNFINGKGIWSGTLFVRGAFQDLFTAVLGWKIFNIVSIGAYRVIVEITKLLIPLGLSLLFYSIWKNLKNKHFSALAIQFMIFFYLYSMRIQNFDRRAGPFLFGIAVMFFAVNSGKKILYFVTGLFSAICSFYSLDIGIYFTALLVILALILTISKMHTPKNVRINLLATVTGVIFGWILLYLFVGSYEFSAFVKNLMYITKIKDLLDSQIYPTPNIIKSFRFTLPLLISSFNILIYLIFFAFVYKNGKLKNEGIIHGIMTASSLLFYRSALGRSDLTHLEYSSSFVFIVLGLNIALIISYIFPVHVLPDKSKEKLQKHAILFPAFLNCFFLLFTFSKNFNPSNIFSFGSRLNEYVHREDYAFYNKNYADGVKRLNQIFADEKCVFSLASDAISPFMLRKPSCNEFYISYFASVDPYREKFIKDLAEINPEYIIYSSKSWTQNLDNITNEQRMPEVLDYVNEKYAHYETVSDYWEIYKRK